jgi:cytochrome oxidase Cu insertion factor (SCO1/SenC/PrrC family)
MLRGLRIAIFALSALAALLLGLLLVGHYAPDTALGRLMSETPGAAAPAPLAQLAIGGPFTLVDGSGNVVTQASYPGRWKLIYFGYTSCPDVCPTTLQAIANALRALGPEAGRVAPLFITVDPARDRPAILARYTALFDPRIIGLTGSPQQIDAAEKAFRVYAGSVPDPATHSYLINHTSLIYLLGPHNHLKALFGRDTTADQLAADLRKALA